jgi:hypothetical protein
LSLPPRWPRLTGQERTRLLVGLFLYVRLAPLEKYFSREEELSAPSKESTIELEPQRFV